MKLVSHLPPSGPALYVAPLLNTVLLLLIFFLLGSSFIVRSGVNVSLPESASRLSGFEDAMWWPFRQGLMPGCFMMDGR